VVTVRTTRFLIQNPHILPTKYVYVFQVILTTNIIPLSIFNGLVFVIETECLPRGANWIFIVQFKCII
jgi:hypothetical protein